MTVYLDTSVVVPLFVDDDHSERAREWGKAGRHVALSAWTLTEFSSAISMQVRMKHLSETERAGFERAVDSWAQQGRMVDFQAERFDDARRLLRKHQRLRAPDALHLAIASWNGFELATLDGVLKEAAVAEGLSVVDL